ncbi:MAG: methylthioribulose 1-phosphate dehydratase [Flavobacteriia bacterium]|jgi:methylthioribulose-1-phosphate dehydratase
MSAAEMRIRMAETIRHYNSKGWSPATSTNYSFRDQDGVIWVSRSGVDKSLFEAEDFITVNNEGLSIGQYEGIKPSAETLIHCVLYELFPDTKVILHSHSVYPVLMSALMDHELIFKGYEVQKGFAGEITHEKDVCVPIFDNTQDMTEFKETLKFQVSRICHHSFVMRKHGAYAWGKDLFEAKRHLETLDYLCQCEWMLKNHSAL